MDTHQKTTYAKERKSAIFTFLNNKGCDSPLSHGKSNVENRNSVDSFFLLAVYNIFWILKTVHGIEKGLSLLDA